MENAIRIPRRCHIFFHKFAMLVSSKISSGIAVQANLEKQSFASPPTPLPLHASAAEAACLSRARDWHRACSTGQAGGAGAEGGGGGPEEEEEGEEEESVVVAATYLPTMRSAVFPSVASSSRSVGKKVRGGWEEEGRKKYKCHDNNSNNSSNNNRSSNSLNRGNSSKNNSSNNNNSNNNSSNNDSSSCNSSSSNSLNICNSSNSAATTATTATAAIAATEATETAAATTATTAIAVKPLIFFQKEVLLTTLILSSGARRQAQRQRLHCASEF